MTLNIQQRGDPFSVTATGSTSAVATKAAVTGKTYYITDIAGSSDKAGSLLLVKQGTTTIWQIQLATTAAGINAWQQSFTQPLVGASGALVSVTVDGTSVCDANISGFSLPN
jgi:hypothetical protein